MMEQTEKASILIVDDRNDKLLALSAIISEAEHEITLATSGKEALRYLLNKDYAAILLDVNMPGLDGFETASLIRQRKNSEHTPIIFITSSFDADTHVTRGYELGAVDYILAPVVPEVLRTKVSAFAELFKKNQQLKKQAEAFRRRGDQLHKITQVSIAIHSVLSVENTLQFIADSCRDILCCHRAVASTTVKQVWSSTNQIVSLSERAKDEAPPSTSEMLSIFSLVTTRNKAIRMSASEWRAHPCCAKEAPRTPGWMAAPLVSREGTNIGVLWVSEKIEGDFNEDEEAMLIQLAQMASIAIENALNSDAREANKIKDEFLAILSHELRTPLTSMFAWTRMLASRTLDEQKTARGLEILERNVRTQTKLIDDLLDVSRIISGKLRLNVRSVDLTQLLETAIDAIRPAAEARGIRLTADLLASTRLLGDSDRLLQVFGNLLSNAVKFTGKDGHIHVSVECFESQVQVRIVDNGVGIDPEFLPKIFGRFWQADSSITRSQGGLGLGLAIVHHLVELHGGTIKAESEGPGKGSTFTLRLPVVAVRLDTQPEDSRSPQDMRRLAVTSMLCLSELKVLIVDDEDDSRETLEQVLSGSKANVQAVRSAREAMEALPTFKPDVLVSDIGMPVEDGYSLIQRVRKHDMCAHIPAIAVTAYAREEDRDRALQAGFQMHLSKPVEPADLIAKVAMLGGRLSKDGVAQKT
ncbi:MAG TPA: response regulator [Planctomycetota bacterium]|nr:response regulator [Planctomycetota bacterium]